MASTPKATHDKAALVLRVQRADDQYRAACIDQVGDGVVARVRHQFRLQELLSEWINAVVAYETAMDDLEPLDGEPLTPESETDDE